MNVSITCEIDTIALAATVRVAMSRAVLSSGVVDTLNAAAVSESVASSVSKKLFSILYPIDSLCCILTFYNLIYTGSKNIPKVAL